MEYRREIDGLRAIAVLSVVFFHAEVAGFSGGYIGVDVFFVISGYLITSILVKEKINNNFSLTNFYMRRARRILPSLFVVLFVSTLLAYIFLPPIYLYYFSQSLISVIVFLSNIYFYLKAGYFSPVSNQSPLLHTWSLAIEEQFYFIFPLVFLVLWKFGKNKILFLLVCITLVSLFFSELLVFKGDIDANFYLIISRAWELLIGSIIAMALPNRLEMLRWKKEILSFIGLFLILFSIFYFTKYTPFPSLYTLAPTLGSAFIIIAADQNTFIGRLLSIKILVWVGLISYSLYLWHQPIFSFLKVSSIWDGSSNTVIILAIIATFVLSIMNYKLVESTFRKNKRGAEKKFILGISFVAILLLFVGFLGVLFDGVPQRYPLSKFSNSILASPKREECHSNSHHVIAPKDACEYSEKNITWAVMGDSHAVEITFALSEKLKHFKVGVKHLSFSGCPPALSLKLKMIGCEQWTNEAVHYLENNNRIKNVILAYRHSAYLYGSDQMKLYPMMEKREQLATYFSDDFYKSLINDPREVYWQSFYSMIKALQFSGKTVFILYPIPELPQQIITLVRPITIFSKKIRTDLRRTTSLNFYKERNSYILKKLDSLEYQANLKRIIPSSVFCEEEYCSAIKNGKALYFDDNHPSLYGAELILKTTIPEIGH